MLKKSGKSKEKVVKKEKVRKKTKKQAAPTEWKISIQTDTFKKLNTDESTKSPRRPSLLPRLAVQVNILRQQNRLTMCETALKHLAASLTQHLPYQQPQGQELSEKR